MPIPAALLAAPDMAAAERCAGCCHWLPLRPAPAAPAPARGYCFRGRGLRAAEDRCHGFAPATPGPEDPA